MDPIAADLWSALRLHARHPRVAFVAALTLALGIGANTAIFSVVDQALFRKLPYAEPDRLVHVVTIARTAGGGTAPLDTPGARLPILRSVAGVFDDLATFSYASSQVLAGGAAAPLRVGGLTPRVASFLGVAPALGRFFGDADGSAGDAVVISDAYWRRAFASDPGAIGRTIPFGRGARVIVGVMPPAFRFFVGADVDAWWPIAESDGEAVIARIRPGLTIDAATRALRGAIQRPEATWKPAGIELWAPDASRGTPTTNAMLLLLFGSVGALLLIACTNVANLLLSSTLERQREIAVRSVLGASRLMLVRQFAGGVAALGGNVGNFAGRPDV